MRLDRKAALGCSFRHHWRPPDEPKHWKTVEQTERRDESRMAVGARPAASNRRHRGLTWPDAPSPPLYAGFRDILRNLQKKLAMGVISAVSGPLLVLPARRTLV